MDRSGKASVLPLWDAFEFEEPGLRRRVDVPEFLRMNWASKGNRLQKTGLLPDLQMLFASGHTYRVFSGLPGALQQGSSCCFHLVDIGDDA